jgi:hypothetical protein
MAALLRRMSQAADTRYHNVAAWHPATRPATTKVTQAAHNATPSLPRPGGATDAGHLLESIGGSLQRASSWLPPPACQLVDSAGTAPPQPGPGQMRAGRRVAWELHLVLAPAACWVCAHRPRPRCSPPCGVSTASLVTARQGGMRPQPTSPRWRPVKLPAGRPRRRAAQAMP